MQSDDIELAARTMTEAEPPADLERRIRRRLDEVTADTRAQRRSAYWWVAAGVTTATVAVLAVLVVPGSRGPEVPQFRSPEVPEFRSPEVPGSRSPEVPEFHGTEVPTSAVRVSPAPIQLPPYRSASESELSWMARRLPALEAIEPIQPEPVSITPLTMTPITALPMYGDSDEGRLPFN